MRSCHENCEVKKVYWDLRGTRTSEVEQGGQDAAYKGYKGVESKGKGWNGQGVERNEGGGAETEDGAVASSHTNLLRL